MDVKGTWTNVLVADRTTATSTSDPAKSPEFGTERGDLVGRVVRVFGEHQLVGILCGRGGHGGKEGVTSATLVVDVG